MRFGFWPCPWLPYAEVIELCTHAEATGWDGVWVADHFMAAGSTPRPFPEAWTTLSAIGARVPRVRVGTMVTGNTYRHPAVLAKMAA
ncbi:MAG: LLM class flavin-dependent oxidoreductase, partial [Gammaproteobacteria bacterium]|nr:LLM class flavin-dependent oxidoreductase [Gammaproteobacteria bacterium]